MATITDAPRRRRWRLRRIETELPLRLPVEPPALDGPIRLADVGVARDAGSFLVALVHLEITTTETSGLDLAQAESVSLEMLDARETVESSRLSGRPSSLGVRRPSPAGPRELSLAERLLLVLQPPLEALLEPAGMLEWPGPLYPYQHDGVRALVESDALLLADDMGLGKTIQAIAAIRALVHLRRAHRTLVVAPASLVSQWRREFDHWAPELRVVVVRGTKGERIKLWGIRSRVSLVSYETLREDVDEARRYGPSATDWDVVALDEAQKIKNAQTKAAQACKSLHRRAAWALTGTPIENDLDELASIVQFLTPYRDGDRPARALSGDELLERHRQLQLRRRKEDVLSDLPPKSVNDIWLELGEQQRYTYDRAEKEGVVHLKRLHQNVTIANVLALIQRLKQICNVCPSSGESAKLDDLGERIDQIASEGQRALVFSQYVHDDYGVGAICDRLDGVEALAFHGSLSPREKDEVISTFKNGSRHKALVLSLRAGGQGLNLQEASYVFHFDRWWNPAVERQAEDRTHRIGQKTAVTVYRYICENTIEEKIDKILRAKQHLFDEYIDKVTIDPGKLLGEKEIYGLFDLEPPRRGGGGANEELAA